MNSTGAKWSKDETRFGKQFMKKAGWEEGKGLGRNEDGIVDHVKTVRKDNVLGIGHDGQIQQTWSTQSVGFADILSRINSTSPAPHDSDEDDDGAQSQESSPPVESPVAKGPTAGRHAAAYTKRRNLKTEALRSDEGRAEVLGAGSSGKRARDDDDDDAAANVSTLTSPLLLRLMDRCTAHEPRSTTCASTVAITKPDPRPPRPTDTPFLMK